MGWLRLIGRLAPGPLPLLVTAFAAGLVYARELQQLKGWEIFPLAAFSLLLSRYGARRLALGCLLYAFFCAGALRSGLPPLPGSEPGPCASALAALGLPAPTAEARAHLELEGRIKEPPALGPESNRAVVELVRAREARSSLSDPPAPWRAAGGLRVQLSMRPDLRPLPGDGIRAFALLDDVVPTLPGGAAARDRFERAGIACSGRVDGARLAVLDEGGGLRARIEALRRSLANEVRTRTGASPTSALLAALTVGDRSSVSQGQAERFAASGLSHLLSVSGLHLGLTVLGLYRLILLLCRRLSSRWDRAAAWDPQRLAALLTLPAVPAYALLTGAQPPVVRAAVGAGLFLLAQLTWRAPEAWTALAAAAFLLLCWDPSVLFQASFQLSFAACAGLLALSPGLRELIPISTPQPGAPRLRRWLELPFGALATTLGATLATLPFSALHFQRASLASLPANVVAVPVGLVTTALCAMAAAAGLVSRALMAPFLWLASPFASLLDWLAAWFATWPLSRIPVAAPTSLEMIATWAAALALARLRRAPKRALATIALALLFYLGPPAWAAWGPAGSGSDQLLIDFLAVGQGDSTLLRLPGGQKILVDTGGDLRGERDLAERILLPQLLERGVRSLDVLALSHLHPDHVGSAPRLLALLPVGEVWTTGRPLEGKFGGPIAVALEEHGVPRRVFSRGSPPLEIGDVRFEFLGPPDREGLRDEPLFSANDGSLVLRIVHGDVTILLPGDVEAEGEEALVGSGADLSATLLKAPHHGSSTSSTAAFLEKVRPHHVVFCVGHRNQFDFPRKDVVERYEKRRCQLHRTDRGAVRFASDGKELRLLPPGRPSS